MLETDWLEQIKKAYPKRSGGQGWGYLKKRIPDLVRQGESFDDLIAGAKRYALWCNATGNAGTQFVMQARRFYGPDEWWLEDYDLPTDGSVKLTLDQEAEQLGLVRAESESDESLKNRMGIAMTRRMYAKKA